MNFNDTISNMLVSYYIPHCLTNLKVIQALKYITMTKSDHVVFIYQPFFSVIEVKTVVLIFSIQVLKSASCTTHAFVHTMHKLSQEYDSYVNLFQRLIQNVV